MTELNVEHIFLFAIVIFLLYFLIGNCGCRGNGFSVGGDVSSICNDNCYCSKVKNVYSKPSDIDCSKPCSTGKDAECYGTTCYGQIDSCSNPPSPVPPGNQNFCSKVKNVYSKPSDIDCTKPCPTGKDAECDGTTCYGQIDSCSNPPSPPPPPPPPSPVPPGNQNFCSKVKNVYKDALDIDCTKPCPKGKDAECDGTTCYWIGRDNSCRVALKYVGEIYSPFGIDNDVCSKYAEPSCDNLFYKDLYDQDYSFCMNKGKKSDNKYRCTSGGDTCTVTKDTSNNPVLCTAEKI